VQVQHSLKQWNDLAATFQAFFSTYGTTTSSDESCTFVADPKKVETAFSIHRDGRFSASMPLHEVDARVEDVIFGMEEKTVQCKGVFGEYTYRIPQQLIGA